MPYIKSDRRVLIDGGAVPENAGELNYALSMLGIGGHGCDQMTAACRAYLEAVPLSYQRINDVLGATRGAQLEVQRRVGARMQFAQIHLAETAAIIYDEIAVPYERTKVRENGDLPWHNEVTPTRRTGAGL